MAGQSALHILVDWRRSLLLLCLIVIGLSPMPAALAQNLEKDWQFVKDVLVPQLVQDQQPKIAKWQHPLRIGTVFSTSGLDKRNRQKETLTFALAEVSVALSDPKFLLSILSRQENPNLTVQFVPVIEFYEIFKGFGLELDQARRAEIIFDTDQAGSGRITQALLLIDEELDGEELRQVTLSALLAALGLPSSSEVYPDSIFYNVRGFAGDARKMSDRDQKLVRFFHKHLEAGDNRARVRAKFDKHWMQM